MECDFTYFTLACPNFLLLGLHQNLVLNKTYLLFSCNHSLVAHQLSFDYLCLEKIYQTYFGICQSTPYQRTWTIRRRFYGTSIPKLGPVCKDCVLYTTIRNTMMKYILQSIVNYSFLYYVIIIMVYCTCLIYYLLSLLVLVVTYRYTDNLVTPKIYTNSKVLHP